MKGSLVFVLVLATLATCDDLITSLPNFSGNIGKQYSGYLNINNSTGKYLHYWFVQSFGNPSTDPVVLWLNGGPGCSSMDGFWYEHGPFKFGPGETNLTLELNPYAWTTVANVLYLEAPAGVGFSYSDSPSDYSTNDNTTADDNLKALQLFFTKYPQFAANDFYISGESYAGIYVPMLAERVMKTKSIKLKGILVGNGLADYKFDNTFDAFIPFAYGHGIISSLTYADFQQYCIQHYDQKKCSQVQDAVGANMEDVDIYDIYGDCYHQRPYVFTPEVSQMMRMPKSAQLRSGIVPPCTDATKATDYLNTAAVKSAIHVKTDINWEICSSKVKYNPNVRSVIPAYLALIKGGYKILVFSGDTDGAVPYTGTEAWINSLNLGTGTNKLWKEWLIQKEDGKQRGGYVTYYNGGLIFATVQGAGHMVPQFRPEAALHMFQNFLNGQPL